jgi:hypothetical protein
LAAELPAKRVHVAPKIDVQKKKPGKKVTRSPTMHLNEAHQPPPSNAASPPPRRDYLRPQYVDSFRCIGPTCEDTCCQGWSVPIDQATYEKYAVIESMKPHLGTIVPNPEGAKRSDFARIRTTSTSACFFLDEERLCSIQRQHGPSLLSNTCATYPRSIGIHSGVEERSLSLSCPEAARLTLLHDSLLGSSASLLAADAPWQATGPKRYAAIFQEIQRFQEAERCTDDIRVEPVLYDPLLATREFALLVLTDRSCSAPSSASCGRSVRAPRRPRMQRKIPPSSRNCSPTAPAS